MIDDNSYNWVIVDDDHTSWTSYGTLAEVLGEYSQTHDELKIIAIIRGTPEFPHM